MMLALPVQTFASVAMLGCAFSHQGNEAHQMHEPSAMVAESACHEPGQTDFSSPQDGCKHCTACYMASALLVSSSDTPPVILTAQVLIPHADDAFVGHIPDSPDRPPQLAFV